MSKRKAATASKHARSPNIVAKAQRANQAIVRSPKDSRRASIAAGSIESSHKGHNNSKQEAPASPAAADDFKQTMRNNESNRFDFSSATASVRAYQAKLLEMAQANMQFSLEFAQRLATIGSPFELLRAIEELTTKRIAMFRKYSKEIVELSTKR
jgi:Phasin protein